jgi:hypothetical protein
MLCNGKSGRCNTSVEPKRLADRDHYECDECGEKWDTDPDLVMHERAGAAIETLYSERLDEHLSVIAHHYSQSRNA